MTTETIEELREKAGNAAARALEHAYGISQARHGWASKGGHYIANAVLDAVGFDARMEEREALREALRWYGAQVFRMGKAAVEDNHEVVAEQFQVIGSDFGKRARVTLKE